MALQPYNIKIPIYCASESEAKMVQEAIKDITKGVSIRGSEILNFYGNMRNNMTEFRQILGDVIANPITGITSNMFKITKLLKK